LGEGRAVIVILAPVSYAIAALLFLLLTILVATGWGRRLQSGLLLVASLANAVWAGQLAIQSVSPTFGGEYLFVVEVVRLAVWLAFLVAVLGKASNEILSPMLRWSAYLVPVAMLLLAFMPIGPFGTPSSVMVTGTITLCLIGLALTERIYGSADPVARLPIGYLCIAMIGLFGYDLVLFSVSVLSGQIEGGLLVARGFANAVLVPFLAVAARRNRDWPVDMFVSRQVAYFGVTFFGAGIYLLLMSIGGYYVKEFGGDWGTAAAAIIVFGAVIVLVTLLLSDRFRRKAKVFFSKHFFRNRYDYREEWMRLSQTLYHPGDRRSLGERGIEAVARIFHSRSGLLLFQREGEQSPLEPYAAWKQELPGGISVRPDSQLVIYLESSSWIIDTRQFREDPSFYGELELPGWITEVDAQQIIVPLLQDRQLIGLIVLTQDDTITLTYEDTDLLKIIGRQVAGVLTQQEVSERLAEGRQFQAYSRLSAFLMHDLKNVAAQQSLVIKNAEKFKHNPEFIDDAFETIEHSVQRVNRVIAQLAERSRREQRQRVNVAQTLNTVVESVSDRSPQPQLDIEHDGVTVSADKDKLAAIFSHVLRNAQDACEGGGSINVVLRDGGPMVDMTVTDTGVGMDNTFIRERLFRPFESTKGVDGMGIGAYQVREYVRELNGSLDVDSAPGQGTTVTIRLPSASGEQETGMDT